MNEPAHVTERYHAFDDPVQDKLLGLILALGAEVWVLRDRVALLETALEERGVNVKTGIDRAAQTPERISAMQQDRTAFFERFLRVLGDQG